MAENQPLENDTVHLVENEENMGNLRQSDQVNDTCS